MSSAKRRLFSLGLNELIHFSTMISVLMLLISDAQNALKRFYSEWVHVMEHSE